MKLGRAVLCTALCQQRQGLGCGYGPPQDAGMTICGGIPNLHGWVPPPQDLVYMHIQTGDQCE